MSCSFLSSSTGTLGLWQALKTLGYTPFHISELLPYGFQQMRALQEAIVANDTDKPFGRAEFDKLFAGYDVSVLGAHYSRKKKKKKVPAKRAFSSR